MSSVSVELPGIDARLTRELVDMIFMTAVIVGIDG
jgi:hypothetical protein